jgi:hypothetical protein
MEVSGAFARLETARYGKLMYHRMGGCRFCSLLPFLGPVVGIAIAVLGFRLAGADMVGESFGFSLLIGGLIGWVIGLRLCQRLSATTYNRVLDAGGMPLQNVFRAILSPDGVTLKGERQTFFGAWVSVSDLMLIDAYWAFVCDGMGLFVPRRFFATPEQERVFLAEALSFMTDRARGRSPDAVDVSEGRLPPGPRTRA